MKKETFALIAGLIRWQCDFCGSRIDPDNDQDWYGALFSHADASDRFVRNLSAAYCGSCLAINVNLKE